VDTKLSSATYITWGLATALAVVAGWIDFRTHRLPNWLTVSGLAVGIAANGALGRWTGFEAAFLGALIPLAALLPVVLLRGLGAGDWKLMGAMGAIVGKQEILQLLFVAIVFAGIIAIVQMVRQRRVLVTFLNLWELTRGFCLAGLKPHPEVNLDNPAASTLPFGVAVAAATLLCCGAVLAGA
jgi:prepilin peptidase CpaA